MNRQSDQKNKNSFRILCVMLFFFALVLVPIQKASAGWPVTDVGNAGTHAANLAENSTSTAYQVKQFVINLLAAVLKSIAQVLLNKLTQSTVNWVNGGFQGSPQFIQNPQSFFKNIGDIQLENTIDAIGYNISQYPYGRDVATALIANYRDKNGSIDQRLNMTMSSVIGPNWQNFQNNFNTGGWNGYNAFLSNPANNPYGSYIVASGIASNNVNSAKSSTQSQVQSTGGFLNQRVCVAWRGGPQTGTTSSTNGSGTSGGTVVTSNPSGAPTINLNSSGSTSSSYDFTTTGSQFLPPTGGGGTTGGTSGTTGGTTTGGTSGSTTSGTSSAQQQEHQFLLGGAQTDANCTQWQTLSPGSVVESQINTALGTTFTQSALGAALGNSISSIVNALVGSLLNKGLSALSTISTSSSSSTQQNWAYTGSGQSISLDDGNGTNGNGSSNWANAADQNIDFNQLFYTGEDIGVTDSNGNPQMLTLVDQAQLQANAYKDLITLFEGGKESSGQTVESFAQMIKDLDDATPGPKYGWQNRLNTLISNAQQVWNERAQTRDIQSRKTAASNIAEALGNYTDEIPQQIQLQVLSATIPSYGEVQALIKNSVGYASQESQFVDNYTSSLGTLSRLEEIKNQLDADLTNNLSTTNISTAPDTGLTNFLAQQGAQSAFHGVGLDDGTWSGTYTGTAPNVSFVVTIDSNGTANDTFSWQEIGGAASATGSQVAITGAAQTLADGISITFASVTGHTLGDAWIYAISPTALPETTNYPPNVQQFLANMPAGTDPFDYLSLTGQADLKAILAQYALLQSDLPNSETIQEAQDDLAQVQSQEQDITDMIGQVRSDIATNVLKNIYVLNFAGNHKRFIQEAADEPATIVDPVASSSLSPAAISAIRSQGYYTASTQDIYSAGEIAGSQISLTIANFFTFGALTGLQVGLGVEAAAQTPKVMYVSPVGTSPISGISPDSSGLSEIPIITTETPAQITTILQGSPWDSGNLSSDDATTLSGFTDQQLTALYSLIMSTGAVQLGDGWDPSSTGTTRLSQGITIITDYDGEPDSGQSGNETGEKMFYCQSVLDKYDDQSVGGPYDSLFRTPKVDIKCDKFYDSDISAYTSPD